MAVLTRNLLKVKYYIGDLSGLENQLAVEYDITQLSLKTLFEKEVVGLYIYRAHFVYFSSKLMFPLCLQLPENRPKWTIYQVVSNHKTLIL